MHTVRSNRALLLIETLDMMIMVSFRHRPFQCFYWHFQNQRRRRPFRRKDGTSSYDPDFYCNDYDEQAGVCSNGDE